MKNRVNSKTQANVKPRVHNISLARELFYSFLILLLVFGTPEILLRIYWNPPAPSSQVVGTRKFVTWLSQLSLGQNNSENLYRDDANLLWSLQPNAKIKSFNHHHTKNGEKQTVHITINSDGYRGKRVDKRKKNPGEFRVLCMGDSNFFGYPLDGKDTFPRVLADSLLRGSPSGVQIEVINGGIPGFTVLQGQRWYQQQFQENDFDWLLLSYLNNDAWLQPQADRELLNKKESILNVLSLLAGKIQLVLWAKSWIVNKVPKEDYVPRVSLDEFIEAYQFFISAAREKGAQVMILDYRAYPQYEPYSRALQVLAKQEGVEYFAVAKRITTAFENLMELNKYPDHTRRVQRRWGVQMLKERAYLWYFAEFYPEHLNELGVKWLTDQVVPILKRTENKDNR